MAVPTRREQTSEAADEPSAAPRWANVAFAAVAFLALGLGLALLGDKSFSGDEGTNALWTGSGWRFLYTGLRQGDANMSLYYGFQKLWRVLGDDEATLRLPSVLAAAASVFVVAKLAQRLFGARTGVVAAVIFATGALLIEHAQNARGYAFLVLLTALATYAFVIAIEEGGRWAWIAFTALTVLAVYAHLFALLVLFAQVLSVSCSNRSLRSLRPLWTSVVAIGVLCLPIAVAIRVTGGSQIDWIPAPTYRMVRDTLGAVGSGTARSFVLAGFLVVAVVALVRLLRASGRGTRAWRLGLVVAWLTVPPVVTLGVALTVQHVWLTRYLVIELAPLAVVAAYGITRITDWRIVAAATAVIVALGVPSLRNWYTADTEDFRGAAASVLARVEPGDGIVFCGEWIRRPFEYYAERHAGPRPDPINPRDAWGDAARIHMLRGDERIRDALASHPRVWLVTYLPDLAKSSKACRARGRQLSRHDFNGVLVRLIEPDA